MNWVSDTNDFYTNRLHKIFQQFTWDDQNRISVASRVLLTAAFHAQFNPQIKKFNGTRVCYHLQICMNQSIYLGHMYLDSIYPNINCVETTCNFLYVRFRQRLHEIQLYMNIYNKAALKIQKNWRFVISNPSYHVCQRRILRDFQEMM